MKFKLVESIDDRLVEKSDPRSEIAKIGADLANAKNRPRGYISSIGKRELKQLEDYCNKIGIPFEEVKTWQAHHIDGINPGNKSTGSGSFNNVALIKDSKIHNTYTDQYKKHYQSLLDKHLCEDPDINALMLRIYAKCLAKKLNPKEFIVCDIDVTDDINKVKQMNIDFFNNTYQQYDKQIICLRDVFKK